ncbi:MAG: proline--tRNA ligase [Mycoplasmataceae bacterium]|nr:proline--tRNA ligase [Mycoplasmataceae bacterium]
MNQPKQLNKIVKRETNYADWYTSVINAAKLITYGDIKGTLIYQPRGWAIWQNIQIQLDKLFATQGIVNVQLPSFIKSSQFHKEKAHIKGFAPELFLVTQKGTETLTEPYVIRPTSEVSFCNYFKQIITSYADLPLKYNQWCNVYRVEKNTRPFLRNSEFYWQELHTIHASALQAQQQAMTLAKLYKQFINHHLGIDVLMGEKTVGERFAGAENTYTLEAFLQDGQALQCATAHYLGQNFAKAYDIQFQSADNEYVYPYQTSAGLSTRLIGAIIMSHADDKGLVLPFTIAPCQIMIIPINHQDVTVKDAIKILLEDLQQYRVQVIDNDYGFGYKMAESEVQGVPLTIVVGVKDLAQQQVTVVSRINGHKQLVQLAILKQYITQSIQAYQEELFANSHKRLSAAIVTVDNLATFKKVINNHQIALAPWSGDELDEKKLQELTQATPRCIQQIIGTKTNNNQKCFFTDKPAKMMVYFARAY